MLTLFANPHVPTSAGNADLCTRPSVLKVAVVAAAAELLRCFTVLCGAVRYFAFAVFYGAVRRSVRLSIRALYGTCAESDPYATYGAPPVNPRPSACFLPLPLHKPLALMVALKTALPCTSEAPCERDLTERQKRVLQHREQKIGARESFVTGLPPPPSS